MEKAREFQKNISFCFIDYAKAFDCVDHNKLWKILKEMGIPDHLYAGQEATVRTGHGTTDWFQIGKGVHQGCILSPCKMPAAAAAKLLQSCPTLCNSRDGSPSGSSIPGILQAILIPACVSSSPAFLMMYSAYKLNKQGDNIQPSHTPFPIWNQSVVPCPVLTVAS